MDALLDHWAQWAPFVIGWTIGWLLLARRGHLTAASRPRTATVAVVIPARDEAVVLPMLLDSLRDQLGPDDELVVVDDGSTDGTAVVARAAGARVLDAGPVPDGWLGKPHACWVGATATTAELVVFLDADVIAGDGFVDAVAERVGAADPHPVSIQPRHLPGSPIEQLSLFGNLAALAATGRWSIIGDRARRPLAFGPVIAIHRERYVAIDGHRNPIVRAAIVDDVALACAMGGAALATGGSLATFRMHPGGVGQFVHGWMRVLAQGLGAAPRWAAVAMIGWCWALAAAPFLGWWAYAAAVLQVGVLARRAGRFAPVAVVCYPVPLAVFAALVVAALTRRLLGRPVEWKHRSIPPG